MKWVEREVGLLQAVPLRLEEGENLLRAAVGIHLERQEQSQLEEGLI